MKNDAVSSLQELGFSLYEARLYLGLLTHGPQNGNELSRTSGVPSSKVYSTLDKLAAAGVVRHIRQGNSAEYVSVPPSELLDSLRDKFTRPLDYLEETLPTLASGQPDPDVLQISNVEAILQRAKLMVRGAESEIYLSAWDENIEELRADLTDADARGVGIFATVYGETELDVGFSQRHSYRDIVASRIGGHMLTVVVDSSEALFAHVSDHAEATGVQTRNPVLCLVAEEYMRHDLLLQQAKTMTGFEEWDRWLQSDPDVRALTLGRTGHAGTAEPRSGTPG